MQRRDVKFELAKDALLCVTVAVALIWATAVKNDRDPAKAGPKINGSYELIGGGVGIVRGKAVVTPKKVKINGTFRDTAGTDVPFDASDLTMDASTYRFKGNATVGNSTAVISGRLDPDDKTLQNCRITAIFLATDAKAGRIIGQRK